MVDLRATILLVSAALLAAVLTPSTAAQGTGDPLFAPLYDDSYAAYEDLINCNWKTIRGVLIGANQEDTAPADFAERTYNAFAAPHVYTVYEAGKPVAARLDVAYWNDTEDAFNFTNQTYGYAKCAVTHYSEWIPWNYVYSNPTVLCFVVYADCGVENVTCNAELLFLALDLAIWTMSGIFTGEPMPSHDPCVPPIGYPECLCVPPFPDHPLPDPTVLLP